MMKPGIEADDKAPLVVKFMISYEDLAQKQVNKYTVIATEKTIREYFPKITDIISEMLKKQKDVQLPERK